MHIHFIQHVVFETPGYLVQWAAEQKYTTSYTRIFESPAFPAVSSFDMLVIMGGPMGVYEEQQYPWIKTEKAFIKDAIDAGKKVFGICLGSQLIAAALGAEVYPNKEKEIGWWPVQKANDPAITNGIPDEFVTFHWHGDTFDLPQGAVHLFKTGACPHQGYAIGNNIAALQFHPEATAELVNQMLQHGSHELEPAPYIQQADAIKNIPVQGLEQQHCYLSLLLENLISS
ncbi:MAG: type 1 glutamine amidotransferase [Chitinophagaceae bacterium]